MAEPPVGAALPAKPASRTGSVRRIVARPMAAASIADVDPEKPHGTRKALPHHPQSDRVMNIIFRGRMCSSKLGGNIFCEAAFWLTLLLGFASRDQPL